MKVAASPQVYMGRCPKVSHFGIPNIDRLTANDKDFSATLSMTIRESPSLLVF